MFTRFVSFYWIFIRVKFWCIIDSNWYTCSWFKLMIFARICLNSIFFGAIMNGSVRWRPWVVKKKANKIPFRETWTPRWFVLRCPLDLLSPTLTSFVGHAKPFTVSIRCAVSSTKEKQTSQQTNKGPQRVALQSTDSFPFRRFDNHTQMFRIRDALYSVTLWDTVKFPFFFIFLEWSPILERVPGRPGRVREVAAPFLPGRKKSFLFVVVVCTRETLCRRRDDVFWVGSRRTFSCWRWPSTTRCPSATRPSSGSPSWGTTWPTRPSSSSAPRRIAEGTTPKTA